MKFDTVIIGGGLAGLTCGIRCQQAGKRTCIVATGQSALHFSSGSFDLLNALPGGEKVTNPTAGVAALPDHHPYKNLADRFDALADEAKQTLAQAGIETKGDARANTYRITPMGGLKSTWLTLAEFTTFPSDTGIIGKNVLIVNFSGFLDFNTSFIAAEMEKRGSTCTVGALSIPAIDRLRNNPTEMRATNIARALAVEDTFSRFKDELNKMTKGYDCVVLPAVFDLYAPEVATALGREINVPVCLVQTMPPSVPGIRVQTMLRHRFESLGGVFMAGDTVIGADFDNNKVNKVYTTNHEEIPLEASAFVLASGSFFSRGLTSTPTGISEPIFGADVVAEPNRSDWYSTDVFAPQRYMEFGVATDRNFHVLKEGKTISNLYAIGSILSGFNPVELGCGAGVAMLTAIDVAHKLTDNK